MYQLQSFSTDSQPAHRRIDYWDNLIASALIRQDIDPLDRSSFAGTMKRLDLGSLSLVELKASASKVAHTLTHIAQAAQPCYLLRLVLKGQIASTQAGVQTLLGTGDFILYDTRCPYEMVFTDPTDLLIIRMPRQRMLPYIGRPESAINVRMPGDSGLSGLASRHLREIWGAAEQFMACDAPARMLDLTLQLLASAYSVLPKTQVEGSSLVRAHRTQIRELIERNLSDPELSPTKIAGQARVTPRYLHRIFSGESETVSQYILRRRLEESGKALQDPQQAGRSVTQIAFDLGFNSLPHFSRVFREHFHASPREYRHHA